MIYIRKILMCVVAACCLSACGGQEDRGHILKVYNWADYIDESVIPEFEEWYKEQTGEEVKVIYQLFDINEIMLSKIERGHDDYDVVCPSEYIIERMLRNDLLLPIRHDFGSTPDYTGNISPYIRQRFDKVDGSGKNANDYAVGYMWGTTGFLYNADKVKREEVSSWSALENPKFHGSMLLKEAFRDVYSVLLTYLRNDDLRSGKITRDQLMYDISDESIAKVENYLKSIRNGVAGWETDFGKEMMTKGETLLNLSWSGDAQWAIEEAGTVGVNLDYVVPEEGSNVWFDGWVIPKYAKNVKAAQYFINFLCRSDIAIRNMDEIGYVSAIGTDDVLQSRIDPESYEPLNASYFFGEGHDSICVNPVQYPDQAVINRCAMMHDSGDRTEALLALWSRVKGDNASSFTYIIILVAIAALITWGVVKKQQKGKHHHKSKHK